MAGEETRIKIEKPCILVVEGDDEERIFQPLLTGLKLSDVIQIVNLKGKGNLRSKLNAILLSPREETNIEIASIAIVMDADDNAEKSFKQVCEILEIMHLPIPQSVFQSTQENPKVTIAILPDGKSVGMLEDICIASVSQTPEMLCVNQFFECLEKEKLELPNNLSKARVQAFLASQKSVGIGVGIAAQKGFWNLEHQAFDMLKDFLRQIPV